ncbi:MAG: HAD-IIIC family phosphatase [Myxococcales bacterium]|nr:MAG: HAD-IIIC family phosphatase [Myxococcales bacterium]
MSSRRSGAEPRKTAMADERWVAARARAKSGDAPGALAALADAVRREELDSVQLERAGALARKLVDRGGKDVRRVAVLGECTTNWLTNALAAVALGDGQQLVLHEGEYDNVQQELHGPSLAAFAPHVVVLVPWYRPLLQGGSLADRVAQWRGAQELAKSRLSAAIVQVGLDWVDPGPEGYHLGTGPQGVIGEIRRANEALRAGLPEGSYFVDLPAVSGDLGRRAFYDRRRYHWTKQPFSEAGVDWLARHLWAGVRAVSTGAKKVLVLDLDNTLWGGVVGEVGASGIEIAESPTGEAHRELQRHAKALKRQGVLLGVASKNDEAEARAPFVSNPEMLLKLEDIASFEAHWEPKSSSLSRMAERLRLGADSFVFLDDNPTEREEIRQRASAVHVVDAPLDPAEYTRALTRGLWFETATLTREDGERAEQYRAEAVREQLRDNHASLGEYLTSLELRADMRDVDAEDMSRVVQLLGKTNQFNLTTPRYSRAEVEERCARPGAICSSLRLSDRFGDYGLILVLMAVPCGAGTLEVDSFLMSCRAIARTVEEFAWGKLLGRARAAGYERLLASYRKTPKNSLVADLYDRLGLVRVESSASEARYELQLAQAAAPVTYVRDR